MSTPYPGWPGTAWPLSLWRDGSERWNFPPPDTDTDADVVIVGAGFTGLWTAYSLTSIDPGLSVIVIDAMQPGYGASGRNGGWCSALMPMSLRLVAERYGREKAVALQSHLIRTVEDIGSFVRSQRIECGWHHGGTITTATNEAHLRRAESTIAEWRDFGFGEQDAHLLDTEQTRERIRVPHALGSMFSPHCAAVDPARLVDGIVGVLVDRGVTIHGHTKAVAISPGAIEVATPHGRARIAARWTVRATEGFTSSLPGHRRTVAPIHSYMIATEPLGTDVWSEIGWSNRETFADGRHVVIYAQRTVDDRIAFGGRGAPYAFGSRIGPGLDGNPRIHDKIIATMHDIFPATRHTAITHRWGGALGVPRDWFTGVRIDRATGTASAGGYVGDGVAFSHLAAKALAHSILDTGDQATTLPIVGHVSPRWEPEPIRWLGINGMLRLASVTDALEERGSRFSGVTGAVLDRFLG